MSVSDDHINGEEGYEVPDDLCPSCCRIPCTCPPSKVPDLSRVPLGLIPALGEDEGPSFSSSV